MADFFLFGADNFPPGSGFDAFGPVHLAFLGGSAVFCVIMCLIYRRLPTARRRTMLKAVALAILLLEAAKQVLLLVTQSPYPVAQLPLHMCGFSIYIYLIHAFFPNRTTGEISYALGLPGALMALITPDWTLYPLANFYCLQSFIMHALLICFPLLLLAGGDLRPSVKNLWRVVAFLVVVVPVIFFVNARLGTNFFFVSQASGGSPLEPLQNLLGNPGYLFGYGALVLIIWALFYLPFILADARKKKHS